MKVRSSNKTYINILCKLSGKGYISESSPIKQLATPSTQSPSYLTNSFSLLLSSNLDPRKMPAPIKSALKSRAPAPSTSTKKADRMRIPLRPSGSLNNLLTCKNLNPELATNRTSNSVARIRHQQFQQSEYFLSKQIFVLWKISALTLSKKSYSNKNFQLSVSFEWIYMKISISWTNFPFYLEQFLQALTSLALYRKILPQIGAL